MIIKNKMSLVDLITFNSLITYFFEPLKNVANIIPKYNFVKAYFYKINEFNNLEEEKIKETNEKLNGEIFIDQLSYSYNNYDYILKSFSMHIKDKKHVFLKGSSGSGKSTICKLLMKYDDNYSGNIFVGGVNIKDYNIDTLRNNITYISQNEKLFTGTIKENITLENNMDTQKINEIIKICKIDEILSKKPLRLDTLLYDDATNLSGGEKQRIILARGLLQDKRILILDEPLSDFWIKQSISHFIINNIRNVYKDKTIIYISHRDISYLFEKCIEVGVKNELL